MPKRRVHSLQRRRATREPKRRFVIVCEGMNTEPAYFRCLQRSISNALIELEIVSAAGVPYTIAQRAMQEARGRGLSGPRRRRRDSYEEKDEVWAVFDRDEHPRYEEAARLCQDHHIGLARSNPCFELWLILHDADYDKPDGRHIVQEELEHLRPEYERDKRKLPDCASLIDRIEAAETRAARQLQRRAEEGQPYGPPSTTVHELTRAIRAAAVAASGHRQ